MRHGSCTFSLLVGILAGCGDGGSTSPTPTAATVDFEYRASTTADPAVGAAQPACVQGVGRTHIHPSWRNFNRIDMTAEGPELWTISLPDAPADQRLSIRISDPNACAENATGAVTARAVFANGTLLTEQVDTPGTGVEPGFALTVDAQGMVSP